MKGFGLVPPQGKAENYASDEERSIAMRNGDESPDNAKDADGKD